jgi:replicative DNA helicase
MREETSLGKVPPQSLEAEMAVLGSMLIDKEAIPNVLEILDPEFIYHESNRKIFEAIIKLYNENSAVDILTVSAELKSNGALESIGGATYLTKLVNAVPTSANAQHYGHLVKEKGILRFLINNATKIAQQAYEADGNVEEILDDAEKLIFEISDKKIEGTFVAVKDIIKDSIEQIDRLYQRKAHVTGIASGFTDFDIKTAGLQPSDLVVIAGRPSMGKSAFAVSIIEHISVVEKIPCAFFSLEMSKEQLVQRLLCVHAKVDAHKVRTGFLSASDWPKLTAAAGKLSEAAIYIDDSPAISVLELRAKARRLKLHHNIGIIVVDYLQLMRGTSGVESRQQEISEISRSLKALARELDICVIGISQLSRAVESRIGHRPQLSDLRESGAIEQDADVVVLLFREEYYDPNEQNKGVAEVNIAKQRNGPVGTLKLAFLKEYMRFENLAGFVEEENE